MADQPANSKKRRLVKNPETFRERAIKAAETSDKPKRGRRLVAASGRAVSPVTTPVSKAGRSLFSHQPFRFIGKVFRFIGRILVPAYLRNSWRELRLVKWPSWTQSRQLTIAVLIFAIIFGATIALVDYGLDKVFKQLLLK